MLGSGRLVLHVPNVSKALVLDNVLFISAKEKALKSVMSRLEVRVTTDQEAEERRLKPAVATHRPRSGIGRGPSPATICRRA